jgi:hypothetical protein
MPNSAEVNWDASVWKDINDAVVVEVGKVRVAQKVFSTVAFDTSPTEIPNDVINFPRPSRIGRPEFSEGSTSLLAIDRSHAERRHGAMQSHAAQGSLRYVQAS